MGGFTDGELAAIIARSVPLAKIHEAHQKHPELATPNGEAALKERFVVEMMADDPSGFAESVQDAWRGWSRRNLRSLIERRGYVPWDHLAGPVGKLP
jgi:hypothetical protein